MNRLEKEMSEDVVKELRDVGMLIVEYVGEVPADWLDVEDEEMKRWDRKERVMHHRKQSQR